MKSHIKTGVQLLMMLKVVLVGVAMLAMPTAGKPNGAPNSSCTTLEPVHGNTTSNNSLPYTIEVSSTLYKANGDITVTVRGGDFAGIIMQVRGVGTNTGTIYGTWKNPPAYTKIMSCSSADNSVTHSNKTTKRDSVFTWTAPSDFNQSLEVVATVAQTKNVWKMGIKSSHLRPAPARSGGVSELSPLLPYVALSLITLGINI